MVGYLADAGGLSTSTIVGGGADPLQVGSWIGGVFVQDPAAVHLPTSFPAFLR
jgi:hypothetical protein